MKKLTLTFFLIIVAAGCILYLPYDENRERPVSTYEPPPVTTPVYGEISIGYIYDYLGNYGYWVYYSPYGYVWVPRGVGRHWRPYTNGRWVWTEYGWTWISHYPWGWIPFHYGRWGWDVQLGWYWVPDIIWAPAWVVWRFGDLYLGWAPLPPGVEFVVGYGLRWHPRDLPHHYWVFIESRRFHSHQLSSWILPPERNITIINYTVIRDRYTFRDRNIIINDAVSPQEIERITGRPVTKVTLREIKKPEEAGVGVDEVRIYKPVIKQEQVVPKSALKKEEAEQKIRLSDKADFPENIELIHKQETYLLEKTQKMEIERLKKQVDEETRTAPPQEKQKKMSEVQAKIEELKKNHEKEKQELQKRQSEEKRVIKKEDIKKKSEEEKTIRTLSNFRP